MYKPLKKWVDDKLAEDRTLKATDLADEAIEIFRQDEKFIQSEFRQFLYSQIIVIIGQTRGPIPVINHNLNETVVGRDLEEVGVPVATKRWREHTNKGWMLLTQMRKPDLTDAIGERRYRIQAEGRRILFLEAVRRGLKDNEQTVGQRYDSAQLESMRRRYEDGTQAIEDRLKKVAVEAMTEGEAQAYPLAAAGRKDG